MTEQKYYDALTQQEVTEDFIKAQYEELTSKGDYFHDMYENFKNNNFKKIDTLRKTIRGATRAIFKCIYTETAYFPARRTSKRRRANGARHKSSIYGRGNREKNKGSYDREQRGLIYGEYGKRQRRCS